MTQAQQAYETIRAHLIQQGRPATDPRTGSCFYRHEGLKCAVGCLIDDDAYEPVMEDNTVDDHKVRDALKTSGWDLTEGGFQVLRDMQCAHDRWKVGDDDGLQFVIEQIDRIAEEYGLEVVK
jgi:hypothetical protein